MGSRIGNPDTSGSCRIWLRVQSVPSAPRSAPRSWQGGPLCGGRHRTCSARSSRARPLAPGAAPALAPACIFLPKCSGHCRPLRQPPQNGTGAVAPRRS